MSTIRFNPKMTRVKNDVLQPKKLPNGTHALYFSKPLPYSDRNNARELIDNKLFYLSAQRFDVFTCFSSHMSTKPAILSESADRLASNFGTKNEVTIKELGAGYGDSMAVLLGDIKNRYPLVYDKLTAYASDGYGPVVDAMKSSGKLQKFLSDNKLYALREDLLEDFPSQQPADYVRISYTLTDLPEDMVKKENGKFYAANVRGYLTGKEDFKIQGNKYISVKDIARLLSEGKIQEIIDIGLDIRDINPRVGFDIDHAPMDFAAMSDGGLVRNILDRITFGIRDTQFRSGLSAARAVEKILNNHLKPEVGSYIEAFDMWTSVIVPQAPIPHTSLDLTSVNSVNLPFVKSYLEYKNAPVKIEFEDWKRYMDLSGPYVYLSHFSKWLSNSGSNIDSFFGRHVPESSVGVVVDFLEATKHVADMLLYSERHTHPAIGVMKKAGFTDKEIDLLFLNDKFPEPDKSKTRGFYGLYQTVTIKRS